MLHQKSGNSGILKLYMYVFRHTKQTSMNVCQYQACISLNTDTYVWSQTCMDEGMHVC